MSDSTSAPRYTLWQAMGAAVNLSVRAIEEVRALSRQPGPVGERGPEGRAGKLPVVKKWTEGVHYEGDVVARDGNTYQALRDTGKEPPADDWICLAQRGLGFRVRGTYDPASEYQAFDIVMLRSSSFVALTDTPGDCPGDGWQLWAGAGKRGDRGEKGERGERGERGAPGAVITGVSLDAREMKLICTRSDGQTLEADLYDFALALKDAS